MRKNRDFVFLRPVRWLGIGMMAALAVACEKPVLDEAPRPDDGEANVILSGSGDGSFVISTADVTKEPSPCYIALLHCIRFYS